MSKTNFVYKLCNMQGDLLYVGKTHSFSKRIRQHLRNKTWAKEIFSVYIAEVDSATAMDIYELYYIGKLKPKYNKDCSHLLEGAFPGELPGLEFKHYFLIDYLCSSDNRIQSPQKIFEERKKNGRI